VKVTIEDLEVIQLAIAPLDSMERRQRYIAGDFPRADLVKDLDKRYRWDLYWHALALGRPLPRTEQHGYTDAHIDTALRNLVEPLVAQLP
jgi:hypothetical protein